MVGMKNSFLAGLSAIAMSVFLGVSVARAEQVYLIKISGAIGPATATYISRAIDKAAENSAQCLVVQLDTPGGLLDSTKVIVMKFLGSPVPIVAYVAPAGASAGSAGCFIVIAADIAAMAPTSNIGAAHPVQMGGMGSSGEKPDDIMKQKLENFTTSYIETIAVKRKRNVEWAKSSVKESSAITADQALKTNVIDYIAEDLPSLLKQVDGREVNGRKLKTAGATVVEIPASFRERVLQAVWRPEIMFVLMLIAMYGIIGELSNPGAILPGVAGAIAVVLLLYMSSVLPMNITGLALIGVAIVLFVADIFASTHGVLTVGGVVSFFIGSMMLFDRSDSLYHLSLAFIIPATIITSLFFVFIVGSGIHAQFLPKKVGREAMIGMIVPAVTDICGSGGKVMLDGEYWNAVSEADIKSGVEVEVESMKGLLLKVRPVTDRKENADDTNDSASAC